MGTDIVLSICPSDVDMSSICEAQAQVQFMRTIAVCRFHRCCRISHLRPNGDKARNDAEAERNAADLRTAAPPASSVGLPNAAEDAVGSAASHLASAGPDRTRADLMDLGDSDQPEVAARARQTLSDMEALAKRRRTDLA